MLKDDLNSRTCEMKLHQTQMAAKKNRRAGKVTSTDNPYLMQQQRQTLFCVLLVLSDGHLHPHLFCLHPQWLCLTHLAPTASTTSVVFSETLCLPVSICQTCGVCVCVCVCVCVFVCVHVHECIHARVHMCMYV